MDWGVHRRATSSEPVYVTRRAGKLHACIDVSSSHTLAARRGCGRGGWVNYKTKFSELRKNQMNRRGWTCTGPRRREFCRERRPRAWTGEGRPAGCRLGRRGRGICSLNTASGRRERVGAAWIRRQRTAGRASAAWIHRLGGAGGRLLGVVGGGHELDLVAEEGKGDAADGGRRDRIRGGSHARRVVCKDPRRQLGGGAVRPDRRSGAGKGAPTKVGGGRWHGGGACGAATRGGRWSDGAGREMVQRRRSEGGGAPVAQ